MGLEHFALTDLSVTTRLLLGFVAAKGFGTMPTSQDERSSGRNVDSATLLALCAKGDAKAFRLLYEQKSALMYAVALRITRDPARASDAVHDAMLQVWRNADRYDRERGNADGWLVSLVRYRALDMIRRQRQEVTGVTVTEPLDEDPDALSRLVADADGAALKACLEQVEPPRRTLILLAFIEGLTQSEIATRVGQPLGTVKSSIRRVLVRLRACLETDSPPGPRVTGGGP
jgi:RNA polymerase sigma factor (sigma-70 family)